MAKITNEMVHSVYASAKEVFHDRLKQQDAVEQLESKDGMNQSSATDCINNFKKMMVGKKYVRTYNEYATDYILSQILIDYGYQRYSNAIQSVNKHVDYYDGLGKGRSNAIRKVLAKHEDIIQNELPVIYPDEISEKESLFEGVKKSIVVNSYERNPAARKQCLEHYGFQCAVCDFSFKEFYGSIGLDYIHVHHLIPVAKIGKNYQIDPIKDLRPVCPNCHAMLHKKTPPLTIEELKQCIKTHNK